MAFGMRAALRPIVVLLAALLSANPSGADARETKGVPKSAPAFAKFVAVVIEKTLPGTQVAVSGRLRLDVLPPNGEAHTTDLHNIYSVCQRVPDRCEDEVINFVSDAVEAYKSKDTAPTRSTLRIIVRPSAYVATIRANAKRNRPIAAPLAGDYWIIAVDDRPTTVSMLDENDLAALGLSAKGALDLAMSNTKTALERPIRETLSKKGCSGVFVGDATYTASAVAFPELWADAAQRCKTLFVSLPGSDAIIFTDGVKPNTVAALAEVSAKIAKEDEKPFGIAVLRWTSTGWVFVPSSN